MTDDIEQVEDDGPTHEEALAIVAALSEEADAAAADLPTDVKDGTAHEDDE